MRNSCSIDGCNSFVISHGLCNKHYKRWKIYGDPTYKRSRSVCRVEGCDRYCKGHGLCERHLRRARNHNGDPTAGIIKDGHIEANIREYYVWKAVKARCLNPKYPGYKDYGGRGIKVCDRWLHPYHGFQNFLADMGRRPEGTSLDRIDNESGYCRENCKWSTSKEQNRNRRSNVSIDYKGETHTLVEWSEILDIPYGCLRMRHSRYRWAGDKLFSPPRKYVNKNK